ncbi:glycosyltransferase [Tateyamaria sp. SN6-1]|uniref:glycosyltransferase n=1 Tax=Tateyamaria sp. SN6-1 TaxID=3092148 RepID=UPI0039F4702F
MHIVHLVTRLLRAGSEENTIATCQWQVAAGHRVTLVHGADVDPFWRDHLPAGIDRIAVPQMVHPVRPRQDAQALAALRALYRQLAPDVIHTHQSKAGILGRLAASAVPAARVVHGIHIIPFEGVSAGKRALYIAAERAAARQTDLFIGVSEAVGRAYVDAGIADAARVHCVRSGMDLARFQAAFPPPDATALKGPAGSRVALMMAAFEPRKRHVPFLEAWARCGGAHSNVRLLLAGRGPEEARVRATVSALGLEENVVFCGHRPDPHALFALADLSVLTSEREGLPRVVVQSLAAGCPALVQALPGLQEVVQHGENGWIADAHDMDGVAQRMMGLLSDPVSLARMRRGAQATDVSDWSLEALGARTTALYGLDRAQAAA